MKPYSIGIITGFAGEPSTTFAAVKDLQLSHIQLAYPGHLDNEEGVASILAAASASGIAITTVFCGFAGERYTDIPTVLATVGLVPPTTRAERVAKIDVISAFAAKLGVRRVAAHIGYIPEAPDPQREQLVATLQGICDLLATRDQVFSLETGQETAKNLAEFIEEVDRPNLRVNFDPANMILYGNDEPIPATELLFPWIDGVHCKDGTWPTEAGKLGHEKPWGEGDVDARQWVDTLLRLGYRGPFTIEREIEGDQQKIDIVKAREMLEKWLGV